MFDKFTTYHLLLTVVIINFFPRVAYLMYKVAEWVVRETTCNLSTNKLRLIHSSYFLCRKILNILKSPSNLSVFPLPLVPKCPGIALKMQHKHVLVKMIDRIALEVV